MQTGGIQPSVWTLRTGVIGSVLVLCAFMGWAQTGRGDEPVDPAPAAPPAASAEDLRRGFQQLTRQVGQLQQTSVQSGRAQLGQGETLRKQIAEIEYSQLELGTQLMGLQDDNLQQVQALQVANHRLVLALWMLAGVLLLLARLAWRWRPTARAAQRTSAPQAAAPSAAKPQDGMTLPAPPASPPVAEAEPVTPIPIEAATATAAAAAVAVAAAAETETETETEIAIAEPAGALSTPPAAELEDQPAAPVLDLPVPPAAEPSPWHALVAADLLNTEQALAQARRGFMQPVLVHS